MYYYINLPLTGKEMLSTFLLDLKNKCKLPQSSYLLISEFCDLIKKVYRNF